MTPVLITVGDRGRHLQSELRHLRSAREPWNTPAPASVEAKIERVSAELWRVEETLAAAGWLLTAEGVLARIPVAA